MDVFAEALEQARAFSWIDWTATITAIIYVVLAARENIWCWFWGIISCSLWAYASFYFYQLWMDALLQIFYIVMAFVGIYQWKYSQQSGGVKRTTHLTVREHITYWAAILPATFLFGYFFANYTPAAATYADAFTTILSVAATIILVQKKLETWLYWILADSLYVWLYSRQGAYLFALLMVIYVIIAANGYFSWRRQMKNTVEIQG
ncbi:nicotinamide riboside transporter PnuC [Flavilitoribacter nigricans]|uniref:Nicotinamide riboside transporter PnuC n=1 Tax=Flavilitoribacter nigricans (strain ATCC 23147 / DSM 23189 / NBRC 102662 / NCIMB 1420 / SS-2) TaxID=1122177 RepID=A0A2D0MXA8_FLAN2|nr:nicotinamide riboside transporter PnuC [Flavilitoribacter nigricans]PHN00901.1 hypothetical protein CRP01_39875 [Flavilitoribacter nigricans DSM 23189 = NBRC 102662]